MVTESFIGGLLNVFYACLPTFIQDFIGYILANIVGIMIGIGLFLIGYPLTKKQLKKLIAILGFIK